MRANEMRFREAGDRLMQVKERIAGGWIALLTVTLVAGMAKAQSTPSLQDPARQEPAGQEPAAGERQPILEDAFDFTLAPELPPIEPLDEAVVRAAIDKGVAFLLGNQNSDGSWGTHDAQRPFQIYAPIPGAHHGFRAAVTGMAVAALIESESTADGVRPAIDKGYLWMKENLHRVRRATGDTMYNVWAHAYCTQALVRLHNQIATDDAQKEEIKALIVKQLDMLDRYESVDGGWGYYDFEHRLRKPTSSSTSFVNATCLIAMHEAKQIGVAINQKTLDRAVAATLRQQKPDFTYLYGEYLDDMPVMGINRPAGSLGRSQACNAALRLWGDGKITDNVLKNWLYRLYVRNDWLGIGRKRPVPHEAWFQVAGYFYYYGHYYAARCVEMLPAAERAPYQAHLAKIILQYQEPDGSWWDYPMYGYHKPYGTAYAIMTLQRCLPVHSASANDEPAGPAGSPVR